MSKLMFDTALGSLHVEGWRKDTMVLAAQLGERLAREGTKRGEFIDFEGRRAYLKASALCGKARARHTLRRWLLHDYAPRIQEYFNLSWMIERHFQTVLPLAAGAFSRAGSPFYQFLLTAELKDVPTLEQAWGELDARQRLDLLGELGREVGRMHALGFLHHDLFPRNLLVLPRGHGRRIVFLDAWAGGPPPRMRPLEYDIACLLLDGSSLFDADEQRRLLTSYFAERTRQDRPLDPHDSLVRIRTLRRRLVARLEADPRRLRGQPMPPRELEWSALLPAPHHG